MLGCISILAGLLIMMGHHAGSEALFYYFCLEDQVPENHLSRLVVIQTWLGRLKTKRRLYGPMRRNGGSPVAGRN